MGQIVLGMTKEEVVRALGKPTEVSSEGVVYKSKKTGNYLKIHLTGDKVIQVDFTSKDFKTDDDLHTGNFRERGMLPFLTRGKHRSARITVR